MDDKTLADLAAAVESMLRAPIEEASVLISGLSYDSRVTRPGDLFCAIRGLRSDGHLHAADAVAAGAVALCTERRLGLGVPELVVEDARRALPALAAAFYDHPARDLLLLGVTGTNGKTTTAYLLESVLRAAGYETGLIGTVETRIAGESRPGVRTTPESLDLQELLAAMRAARVGAAALEVTSHGLVLHRVDGINFAAAAFTNLSQDHLDFHASMEDYFAAKRSLFVPERARAGAVNVDDPWGARIARESAIPILTYALEGEADVAARALELRPSSSSIVASTPDGEVRIETSLPGAFNAANCLAAAATALAAGIDLNAISAGIAAVQAVPGRFEAVDAGQPFSVIVDYAHTPDSLDNVLRAARNLALRGGGRLLVVFGCGGDRDRGKRPLMGAVAARVADVVIVTSDNPRSENPEAIIGEILEGVAGERSDGADLAVTDRREAIEAAIARAGSGDVVVIAGKGHETGQQFADRTLPFDDREVARAALEAAGWTGGEAA